MQIGILKEATDARVALTPESVKKFIKDGHEVVFEADAGANAFYPDSTYVEAGASVKARADILKNADLVTFVNPPSMDDLKLMKSQAWAVGMFDPRTNPEIVEKVKAMDITAFSMEKIPRTTLAQSMDVLSSMASIAGYKAVLVGASALPSYMPMLMTAAGTIPPAKVLVLGAGVAGLQAIATARRLGAKVEAFDVRSAVKEEVQSLGATFVEVAGATEDKAAGGYAVEQTEEYLKKQSQLIHERAAAADIIVTTANIPGRKAPILIKEATVKAMKNGSVIVDLAAVTGGNCEGTENGKTVHKNGVTIIGESNLPASMPFHASKLYGNNVYNFIKHVNKVSENGLNMEDEIVAKTLL
jgi:NAD(P) transhydrogenase subunit alpha